MFIKDRNRVIDFMNNYLVKNIIYRGYDFLLGRKSLSVLSSIQQSQWFSKAEIEQLQLNSLHELLTHAYDTVPYYRQIMDENNCRPGSFSSIDDIKKLPPLTKDIIRRRPQDLLSARYPLSHLIKAHTTGSTGQPLTFFVSRQRIAFNNAFEMRGRKWLDVDPFAKRIWLWGRLSSGSKMILYLKNIRDHLFNKKIISCNYLDEQTITKVLDEFGKYSPVYLYCYASAIAYIANYMRENDIDGRKFGIKAIITTAETLFPHQKKVIENVFACTVAIEYGSSDAGLTAQECRYGSLHVHAEGFIIENDEENDGELLITNLNSFGMPFIRYRIGDIGNIVNKKCQCGRELPVIESLTGRVMDCLVSKSGRRIDSLVVDSISEYHTIQRFKIHQSDYDQLSIQLIVTEDYSVGFEDDFTASIEQLFGHSVTCQFKYVDEMENTSGGKLKYISSDVA